VDLPLKTEVVQRRVWFVVGASLLVLLVVFLFLISVELGIVLFKANEALPDIKLLENWRPNESTRIFDRTGTLIANIHGDEDRVVVPLSDISPNVMRAVMAIEDNRFYQHGGVDVRGTVRALVQNLKKDDVQGGSTVTQQLVKNLFLTPERSLNRKIAEAILSVRVERAYPKNRIMEMYLNQVYWGNQAYGIEKAARRYYKKAARDLTIAEAALLAGLLKAPEGLSPFHNWEAAKARQLDVLQKMVEYGYITETQRREAAAQKLEFNTRQPKPSRHPYFVAYVIQELQDKFGEDVVRRGGLKVYTTMDEAVQAVAEDALVKHIQALPKGSQVTQGALVAIDNQTAEIMALVGGVDFEKSQYNNATQGRRAPGSSFKPFVYLTGLRLGLITPESPISDRPVYFNTGYGIWSPKNWDGRFMGAMNIRRALTLSRNTTTVQVGMRVGIDEVIRTARLAGIRAPIDRNFSSLLGSSGVSPLEVATAYATFARGGIRMFPTGIRRIETARGEEVPIDQPQPERVFDPEPVANLVSILVDAVEKGTGRNAMLTDEKGTVTRRVAGKTGTTDSVRDIWFTGFTPDLTACVWMGNTGYVPLHGVFSSNAAKVWHDFSEQYYTLRPVPAKEFPTPPPMVVKQQTKPKPTPKKTEDIQPIPTPDLVPTHEGPASAGDERRGGTPASPASGPPPSASSEQHPGAGQPAPPATQPVGPPTPLTPPRPEPVGPPLPPAGGQ
jgi:penicillin-binding protein 1A